MRNTLLLLAGAIALFTGQSHADGVIDWNATAITVMLRVPTLARAPSNDMAYVHVAIYDAVNAIDGQYSVFAVSPSNAAPWASKEAAVAAAARRVLLTFYASQQPYIDSVYNAAIAPLPNDSTKTRGLAIGDTVATRFLALRAGDGRDAVVTYVWQTPGPGVYQPTPPGAAQYQPVAPWLPLLRPFSFNSPSQFRAPGPASLTSDVYTRDFNEVKRYGSRDSSLTTPLQREMARFHTENPAVQLARNIRLFAAARGMSLADNARLFAQLYVTIGDASIAGFESKYFYNYWRPSTAIREADTDENPLTERDTSWSALVNTPTHPEYPAAHGLAMGGLAHGLAKFFGTTSVPLTLTSNVTGTQHAFNNVNELIAETINARVYGGMHFRSSVEDGIAIGRDVAAWVARRYFIRLSPSPWTLQRAAGLAASQNPDITFSAVNENVCWGIKQSNSQFVRTTDGGTSWSVSTIAGASGFGGAGIFALDGNTAWVAMRDLTHSTSGGVFKTTDGGIQWTKQTTAFAGTGGDPDIIHFFDSNNGACVGDTRDGHTLEIYTTTNGGTNWIPVPGANIPATLPGETGIMGGGTPHAVGNSLWFSTFDASLYRTTDRGLTWTVARSVIGGGSGFGFAFKDGLNGLACTFVAGNKITRTSDGGVTWTPVPNVPTGLSTFYISYVPGTSGSYVVTSNSNIGGFTQSGPGSIYTGDGGSTWSPIDLRPVGSAAFVSSRVGWTSGPNDSLYRWDNTLLVTGFKEAKTIAGGFQLEQNYPNPFNPSTTIRYALPAKSHVTLVVFNTLGQQVAVLQNGGQEAGPHEVKFDASRLATGVYFYRIHAGESVQTKKLLFVK